MAGKEAIQARAAALADAEMTKLYADTGIDLSMLPAVIKPDDLAPVMGTSVSALAQDRFRHRGIPYVKFGRRVRYLRAESSRDPVAFSSAGSAVSRQGCGAWRPAHRKSLGTEKGARPGVSGATEGGGGMTSGPTVTPIPGAHAAHQHQSHRQHRRLHQPKPSPLPSTRTSRPSVPTSSTNLWPRTRG